MPAREICSLEYLIGTLATAYKGVITSLIARDFCMLESRGETTLRGTVLGMPRGDYDAVLKHMGIELSRAKIREGIFEVKADSRVVRESANLQIDVIQKGRHIGTFLLKKEEAEGVFVSALELSEEVAGLQFGVLSGRLRQRPGLLKKGEHIISQILSTKRDWGKFSDEINSFANDLFWFDRGSFYAWSAVLLRYAFLTAEKAGVAEKGKATENVLSLLERTIDNEADAARLKDFTAAWLNKAGSLRIDWSDRFRRACGIFSVVRRRFPDIAIGCAVGAMLSSLEEKSSRTAEIPSSVFEVLEGYLPDEDLAALDRFGHRRKEILTDALNRAKAAATADKYEVVFETLEDIDSSLFDDGELVRTFFRVTGRRPLGNKAGAFVEALSGMVGIFGSLREVLRTQAIGHIADMVRMLLEEGMTAQCEKLFDLVDRKMIEGEDIALNQEVASAVLASGDRPLIMHYKKTLQRYPVPPPGIKGFSSETWAELADPLHLKRLSRILRIISIDSEEMRDVMIRLICNLYVSGVFIPDDKLFQREISAYLNSARMGRDFFLHHMLLRRLPVFFSEVGATGSIREYTTEIDSWADDPVLYFLRKQVHVNASNYNIELVERIMESWAEGSIGPLEGTVPEDVLSRLDPQLLGTYAAAARPLLEALGMREAGELHCEKAILLSEEKLRKVIRDFDLTEEMRSKISLLVKIYQGLLRKYSRAGGDITERESPAVMEDCIKRLAELKQIVISPEKTSAEEAFYFKRHIAFGIPSVMGSYNEPKFNAMGEAFDLENRARVILELLIAGVENGKTVSREDVRRWIGQLSSAAGLFTFQDLGNFQVDELVAIFRTNPLSLSQIVDLLRIWQKELTWIVESFHRTFHAPLVSVLESFPQESLPARLRERKAKQGDFLDRAADILIREMMADVAGFLELDRFLGAFISALRFQISRGDDMTISPGEGRREKKGYLSFDELGLEDARELAPLIGGKAKNLAYLLAGGMRVPAGAVFRADRASRLNDDERSGALDATLREAVSKIELKTGCAFGDGKRPLFLSVRSGSYISMPGILSSILYVGMNEKTLHNLVAREGDEWLGWDSMRRFIEDYGTVVFGLEAAFFEEIISRVTENGVELRRDEFPVIRMKALVRSYREEMSSKGLSIPEDVYTQLRESVKAVFASWESEKALRFREAMEISGRWGTSVTLMQMIYGNAPGGGASVFFTRNPFSLEKGVYGDTREQATGVDLVYGKLVNRPLSKAQGKRQKRSLEEVDPELFALHQDVSSQIEEEMGGLPQEVEITYTRLPDGGRTISVLQTRRMEFHRGFTKRFSDVCKMGSHVIGRGAGVHGSALSGIVTFSTSKEHIGKLRESAGMPVILIRESASTDDVALMPIVDGIVTAGGGVASHASVLAQKFDLTAVIGCEAMEIRTDEDGGVFAKLGGREIRDGYELSIDGSTGLIYYGVCSDFE